MLPITIEREGSIFCASVQHPEWGPHRRVSSVGATADEAIGALIRCHGEVVGIKLWWRDSAMGDDR